MGKIHKKERREDIDYDCVKQREKEVRHDVMAHVYAYGKVAPSAAGIIHPHLFPRSNSKNEKWRGLQPVGALGGEMTVQESVSMGAEQGGAIWNCFKGLVLV